jgi:hypothetical protein
MPRKGHTNEEILHALHEVEGAGFGLSELRELRSLRHENSN